MASYFNLTLDTTAPVGLGISLNDNALYTTATAVTLKTTMTDEDTAGYQMKVWGVDGVEDEASAAWETFAAEKSITLPTGDGLKTVHVKVRDDVWNESAAVSDDITLTTAVPVVSFTGPDVTNISKVEGKNSSVVNFTVDVPFVAYKVCLVPAANSLQDAGVVIPVDGGSINTSGAAEEGGEAFPANTPITTTIKGADLEAAGADGTGDVASIIKIFAQNEAGIWSVA